MSRPKCTYTRLLLLILIASITILILEVKNLNYYKNFNLSQRFPHNDIEEHKGYVIQTPGCSIPDLSIDKVEQKKIQKFIYTIPQIQCNDGIKPLVESNITSIFIQLDALKEYNATINDIQCCYRYFKRKSPDNGKDDQIEYETNECIVFVDSLNVDIEHNFIEVMCTQYTRIVYKDYFCFINKTNKIKHTSQLETHKAEDELNVLIFGIDAVSRLNLHRQMPKTVEYLYQLQAAEMLGYNKVADNSFPNLIVVLTGRNEEELTKTCYNKSSYFDNCEFIWDKFKDNGYVTAFGEESAKIGMFTYERMGFKHQPTDYYYNHFDFTAEQNIGNYILGVVNLCLGSRLSYKVLLQYAENYVNTMRHNQQKFFGFFWETTLTHDFLNLAALGDDSFQTWLSNLQNQGVLNNTALILMSDHGMRFGEFRNTYQGVLEDRLPFMFIVLPEWYRNKYKDKWNNLKTNQKRLITAYDLYETLIDLSGSFSIKSKMQGINDVKGISLFNPISDTRTCDDVGIDPHWCTCKQSKALELNDQRVVEAVNYTIYETINGLLHNYTDCYQLRLDTIIDGRQVNDSGDLSLKTNVNDEINGEVVKSVESFMVTFKTKPNNAIFEATVKLIKLEDKKSGDLFVKNVYEVSSAISRLNLYGTQSQCVQDVYVKLFCYCK